MLMMCAVSSDLDYLVPKAGFFCQICSLFYADEISVKNHCKTPLHQQNMEVMLKLFQTHRSEKNIVLKKFALTSANNFLVA